LWNGTNVALLVTRTLLYIWQSDTQELCGLIYFVNAIICIVNRNLIIFLGIWHCKILFVCVVCTAKNIKMVVAKSLKETWLNYNILPIARHFFRSISSGQQLATKDWHVFFFLKFVWKFYNISCVSMNSNHHKVRPFDVPWQQFNKLLQQLLELRTLHRVGSKKCACILSV